MTSGHHRRRLWPGRLRLGRRSLGRLSLGRLWPGRLSLGRLSLVGVGAAVWLAGAPAAGATTAEEEAGADASGPEVELRLTDLTGVLGPPTEGEGLDPGTSAAARGAGPGQELGMRLLVHNRGEDAVDELRVVVEVLPPAGSRHELSRVLDAGESTGSGHVHQRRVRDGEPVAPGGIAGVSATLAPEHVGWAEHGGVHPVRVTLLRGADVLDELTTSVVWLGDTRGDPLLTTMVWPLADAPWRTEGGAYRAWAQRTIRPGGRLDRLLRGLEQHPGAGVLLAPSAHLLEDLRDQASGFVEVERKADGTLRRAPVAPEDDPARRADATLQRLRDVAEGLAHQPVAGPYADADLYGLLRHSEPLRDVAGEAATQGRIRLQRGLERSVDPSSFLVDAAIGPQALDLVPAQHLLLAPSAVDGSPTTAAVHHVRSPSGRPLTASVGDALLTELLSDSAPEGLLGAQRVLAETAMVYFEAPGEDDRVLAVHPPVDWDPDPELVAALLRGLDTAPWLELVSPTHQHAAGRGTAEPLELATPAEEGLSEELGRELETAFTEVEAMAGARPADTEAEAEEPERSRGDLRDALLRASSTWLSGNAEAQDLIRDVRAQADRFFGDVEVASGSQVTLTAETGQVPVTVRRTRGGPVTVRIEVASQGRLVWDEQRSDDIVLTDDEAHTVTFETRALSTGTFPVTVVVTDATGTRELERTTLRVRSTAISGPAVSATGALVAVLLILGVLRRRPREPRLKVVKRRDEAP